MANVASLKIVYAKSSNEKTTGVLRRTPVGEIAHRGKKYLGMQTFYLKQNEEGAFRTNRIIEIQEAETWINLY